MDKTQIQKGTKELLEKADKLEVVTDRMQELLKSVIDKEATILDL